MFISDCISACSRRLVSSYRRGLRITGILSCQICTLHHPQSSLNDEAFVPGISEEVAIAENSCSSRCEWVSADCVVSGLADHLEIRTFHPRYASSTSTYVQTPPKTTQTHVKILTIHLHRDRLHKAPTQGRAVSYPSPLSETSSRRDKRNLTV